MKTKARPGFTVKESLLSLLDRNRGEFLSGAAVAERLSVTRNAVWKAVNALKEEGVPIQSDARGYLLPQNADLLSAPLLAAACPDFYTFSYLPTLPSTNRHLKEMAPGEKEGLVLVAGEQTAGHGRFDRAFLSPPGCGLYMSILLRPALPASEATCLTAAAAVAVAEAAEALTGEGFGIKWVNDVYKGSKKVCGILTEGALSLETGALDYAVLGIGINVTPPCGGFAPSLTDKAGAVFSAPLPNARLRMAKEVLSRFLSYYENLAAVPFLEGYRSRSFLIGKRVSVSFPAWDKPAKNATVLGVDDRFHLEVRYDDGTEEALGSGEVSVRKTFEEAKQ